ncbi:MAG: efflux RND transporter permease subunit [Planctomycetota bacterium]
MSSRRHAALALVLIALPTLALGWVGLRAPVDLENRALKSVGTREALVERHRIETFGSEDELVVLLRPASPGADRFATEVARVAAAVRAIDGVQGIHALPVSASAAAPAFVWHVALNAQHGAFAGLVDAVTAAIRNTAGPSLSCSIAGRPAVEVAVARAVGQEEKRVVGVLVVTLVALSCAFYRHAGLVLAVLVPAGIGIAWTAGIAALLGRAIDPVSVLLRPVLLTVGVASGVHWVEAYLDRITAGERAARAARSAVMELRRPALLACLTTVIGFLALGVNSIPAVVDFGIFAALGVALTYSFASVATPALLVLCAAHPPPRLLARRGGHVSRATTWIARFSLQHARAVRLAGAAGALAAVWACTLVTVDNDPLRVLPSHHPVRRDSAQIAALVGGDDVFEVLIPRDGALATPEKLALFAAHVLQVHGVAGAAGLPLRAVTESGAADGELALRFLLAPGGSAARERTFDEVEALAADLGADDVRLAGMSVQVTRDSARLIRGSAAGALFSACALLGVFWVGFRSFVLACLAMIPNVLPCLCVYGGLGAIGRPLSFATTMIASSMLGLIVDDTIHLLHGVREARVRGEPMDVALEQVFASSGRAVSITTVVLAAGFASALSGTLASTVEFGAVATVTIVVAFACDLFLVPALLSSRTRAGRAVRAEVVHA